MVVFFQIIQMLSAFLVIILVLLHAPKGDGMAAIGGAAQLFSSQKGVEAGLNKLTTAVSFVFIYSSIVLGFKLTELSAIIGSLIALGAIVFVFSLIKKIFVKED